MRQLKLLPGTMLLMLASTLSINPVNAQQNPASGTGTMQNQMEMNTPNTPTRTNTQPVTTPAPMESPSAPSSTPMQMENQSAPSSTDTTTTVSGTIKSIKGEVVTVAMADGMTKEMKVSQADLQRLNLRKGMEISATVDAQSMASDITLAQSNTPSTGTRATSTDAGTNSTSETTPSTLPTAADTSTEAPTTTPENTTPAQSTPTKRPVRALW
jgi:uncharacterized iron-regulated membrane protein